ncbi:MAG: alpha/beta hydrolase [Atopobiaceae bacterium]|jgi:pimeloyl-ACP methyl ester carboxylesterase|nr:alpha/beta hydrolase [Atopobiaceae bacterium]MCH4180220.1 alpha/beta hydrolase [Atopobiaceae bacterium]MCH4214390.1 alpha/beta hydrolase [Atopobiaceae bacterium]MCH4229179.1 alpha/beta hydrolase [Atopobiaceae bacterium]MCH4276550.1 alpha/beta hydrolase [Atopobiaceae bacterium]
MNINIDGYSVNYKVSGDGPRTAVMLQGWGTTLEVYDSVASAIDSDYRFVQLDLPGFGKSDEPREPWDVDAYADFFCKFMAALDIREATLIGHSYGGRVIIKLAAREDLPFTIRDIVLIDSAGIVPEKSFSQRMRVKRYKALKGVASNKVVYALFPELIDDWRQHQGSEDYRNASPIMRRCLVLAVNEDLRDLFPKVGQDVLLVWGDLDTATPIGDAKLMEQGIPGAGLVVLEGAGHFSFLEQPTRFACVLREFLKVGADDAH